MAETTLLRQSAIVRNTSVGSSPPLSPPGALKTGELPLVQVKMAPGAPQFLVPQSKPVEILAPRDANSALRTGGLPLISVRMTSQGPQLDDGQDKPVVILPSKDQRHSIAAGGLPMVDVKMTEAGPQVQSLPSAQPARPQIQGPQPAVSQPAASQPRRAWVGAAPVVNKGRVVRVGAPGAVSAPRVELALPPVPEFTADQLMLFRHLIGKYQADLTALAVAPTAEDSANTEAPPTAKVPEVLVQFVDATLGTVDQALVAVAVRAEAVEAAAAAAAEAAAAPPAQVLAPLLAASPGTSIIPAAPSTAYVAGRVVGGRQSGNGFVRGGQRSSGQAPRRVAPAGELPMVQVKMEGKNAVVQNREEFEAARATYAARPRASAFSPAHTEFDEAPLASERDGIPPLASERDGIPSG